MDNYLIKTLPLEEGQSITSKIKVNNEIKQNGYPSSHAVIRVPIKVSLHLDKPTKITWTKKTNNEYVLKFQK